MREPGSSKSLLYSLSSAETEQPEGYKQNEKGKESWVADRSERGNRNS